MSACVNVFSCSSVISFCSYFSSVFTARVSHKMIMADCKTGFLRRVKQSETRRSENLTERQNYISNLKAKCKDFTVSNNPIRGFKNKT